MNLVVKKCFSLSGDALPPASKSHSIRALFVALLAGGESIIENLLDSEDTRSALAVCKAFGREVSICTGNSGITTHFILPILGLRNDTSTPVRLTSGAQMQARPVHSLITALRHLGMQIEYLEQDEHLPVLVSGRLVGGETQVSGITSQYLSALLTALPLAPEDSVIRVNHLQERPYLDMTLTYLKQQNIIYNHHQSATCDIFHIQGRQHYSPLNITIPADFSSASYLIAAATLIPGEVSVHGLDLKDTQGDKRLISILQTMGADITTQQKTLVIKGARPLKGMTIDVNDIPDLLPTLAVIATQASSKTHLINAKATRIKETDRIHSMSEGLRSLGAHIETAESSMTIYPCQLRNATTVQGYGDHRTVMALALAGLLTEGTTVITNAEAINKTYPDFVKTMQHLGANMRLTNDIHLPNTKHIILLGFKHVGKTMIGRHLAKRLQKNFIDLDNQIEKLYKKRYSKTFSCREIMRNEGEIFFRELENEALQQALVTSSSSIISLGGGTPLCETNQARLKSHLLLHITAPRGIVFERIMIDGYPAFFNENKDPYESFSELWNERCAIYKTLTQHTVDNSQTLEHAVNEALHHYIYHQAAGNEYV